MKKFYKIFSFLVCAVMIISSFTVYAENINVHINSVNLTVNNNAVSGNNVLYNDRTYVPLRVISEMLDKDVSWNNDTKTVGINDINSIKYKGKVIGLAGDLNVYSDEYKLFEEIIKAEKKGLIEEGQFSEEEIKAHTELEIKNTKALEILLKEQGFEFEENFSENFDSSFESANQYYMSQGLGENGFMQIIEFMGYSYDSYKLKSFNDKMYTSFSQNNSTTFTEEKMKEFYDANEFMFKKDLVKAKHILIMTENKTEEETEKLKKKAEDILKRLKNGEDFDKLMNEFSEDPGSKSNPEGYLFGEGEMVKEFEEASFALKNPGDLSDIVKSSYGFHIIKLVDKYDIMPYEETSTKNLIKSYLNKNHIDRIIAQKGDEIVYTVDASLVTDEEISSTPDEILKSETIDVEAALNTVTINVNGKKIDADNIIINGRTYVPLRAISELLSKEVTWNEESRTADISDNFGVKFKNEEEEFNSYISIAKAENPDLSQEELENKAKENMNFDRNVIKYAESFGIKADKEFKKEYDNYLSSLKAQLSSTPDPEKAYQDMLTKIGYTELSIKRMFETDFLLRKLTDILYKDLSPTEDEIKAFYEENKEYFKCDGRRVKHILLYNIDDYGNPLNEEEAEAKKKLADELYQRLLKGEDFDTLMKEYTEDELVDQYPQGYSIVRGDMVKEFEDGAYSIEIVGDVCAPVLSKYGYHIIKLEEIIEYYDLSDEDLKTNITDALVNKALIEKIKNFK